MGISTFLRWPNAPTTSPNGLELIQQRIQEVYGTNVTKRPLSAVVRTHRPHSTTNEPVPAATATAPAREDPPLLLTTVHYPRSHQMESQNVLFVLTDTQLSEGSGSGEGAEAGLEADVDAGESEKPRGKKRWTTNVISPPSDLIPKLVAEKSVFIQPPKEVKEGDFRNVANMTAQLGVSGSRGRSTSASTVANGTGGGGGGGTGKASASTATSTPTSNLANPKILSPQLTTGTTLHLEGTSFEISLGGVGMTTGVEWVVRVLWVGGGGGVGVGVGAGVKGLLVEVEYIPISTLPESQSQSQSQRLLSSFLHSLLPTYAIDPRPDTYVLEYPLVDIPTEAQTEEEEDTEETERRMGAGWQGLERLRRSTWMMVRCLREEKII